MADLSKISAESDSDGDDDPSGVTEQMAFSTHHADMLAARVRVEKQRIILRWCAVGGALLVVLVAAFLEWKMIRHIMDQSTTSTDSFVLLAIAPIASITLIVIFVLIGVFRGYREADIAKLPAETAMRAVSGGSEI